MGGVALLLVLLPALLFWSRLPDPLATQFGRSGAPVDHLRKIAWLTGTFVVWGLVWAVYLRMRAMAPFTWKPPFVFGALGLMFVTQLSIVWSNFDAATWSAARPMNLPLLFAVVAIGWVVFGFVASVAERR